MSNRLPIACSSALAMALAFAAGPAAALGLGQIQVKSLPGQPFVAEIPIISSDPSELQGLTAQLAAPETFSRVGLEPPVGLVSALHFEPALDGRGRPVIRVSSEMPVQQPLLTFLLEVDWGEGRLVREYSALLDTPRTVSAPLQPAIQAPVVAPANTIVRPVAPPPVAQALPPNPRPAPAAIPVPSPAPPVAAAVTQPAAPAAGNEYGPVRPGQTLGEIAANLGGSQYSVAQTMLALLRANPDAFIDGNINRLRRGAVLRVPQPAEIAKYEQGQAATVVREQMAQWRNARRTAPQPAAVASRQTPARVTAAASVPARAADARLEILPPSARRGQRAGAPNQAMQSGIQAGGEGEMLRQQLQETKETLAARDAEVNELKTRVAELEKLRQQQQQLLTLKDSALATAQQNLATSNRTPAVPTPATAAATTGQATQPVARPHPAERNSGTLWLWSGVVLVLVALAGWLLTRRRRPEAATPRRMFDTAALAASIPVAEPDLAHVDLDEADSTPVVVPAAIQPSQPRSAPPPPHWTAAPVSMGAIPTWHGGSQQASITEPGATGAGQQLELAQAYLDLGDGDAARALLRDVLHGQDPAARETAARLLRDL